MKHLPVCKEAENMTHVKHRDLIPASKGHVRRLDLVSGADASHLSVWPPLLNPRESEEQCPGNSPPPVKGDQSDGSQNTVCGD